MRRIFINTILSIFIILFHSSCTHRLGNQEVKVTIAISDIGSNSSINEIVETLEKRLDTYGVYQEDVKIEPQPNGELTITVKGIDNRENVIDLLTKQGKLQFWSHYDFQDLYPFIQLADSVIALTLGAEEEKEIVGLTEKNPNKATNDLKNEGVSIILSEKTAPLFYAISNSMSFSYSNCIVFESEESRNLLMNQLGETKKIFPNDFVYLPGKSNNELAVYFLRLERGNKPLMSSPEILEANAEIDYIGKPMISLRFGKEDAMHWKRITASKINQSIPMALDDFVFMAPTVQSEIPNGRSQISGDFTIDECKYLAIIVQNPLPTKVKMKRLW